MRGDEGRQPPHENDAEIGVLGSALLSADKLDEVAGIVRPANFYRPAHQVLFEVLLDLKGQGGKTDPTSVLNELRRRGQLREGWLDGPYLHTLTAAAVTASAGHHAEIVAEVARRRHLIEVSERVAQLAWDPRADLADVEAAAARILDGPRGGGASPGALAARYVPVDWETAWKAQPDFVEWLIEPFLEAGTVNALFAKAGTGKSLLALEWALRLARDERTVVYIDDENRVSDVVERLQAFGAVPSELSRLLLYSFAGLPPLDTPAGGAHLLALADAVGAALVVLDTTMRMVEGEENDADTFQQLYRCSLVPLKSRGITVLRLDHPGKDENRGQRGSSAKDNDVDTVWRMTEQTQGRAYRLHREKNRTGHAGDSGDVHVERRYAPLRHEWTCPDSGREKGLVGQLAGQLDRLGVPPSAGRDRCRTVLNEAGIPISNALLADVVRYRKTAPDSSGTAGQPVLPLPTVPVAAAHEVGGGGQVGRHQSEDSGEAWPADTIGSAENEAAP